MRLRFCLLYISLQHSKGPFEQEANRTSASNNGSNNEIKRSPENKRKKMLKQKSTNVLELEPRGLHSHTQQQQHNNNEQKVADVIRKESHRVAVLLVPYWIVIPRLFDSWLLTPCIRFGAEIEHEYAVKSREIKS